MDNSIIIKNLNTLDDQTRAHSVRCSQAVNCFEPLIGNKMKLLKDAALLHDVGKAHIPKSILLSTDKLTQEERDIIDKHSYFSYQILKEQGFDDALCKIALFHHGDKKLGENTYSKLFPPDKTIILCSNILRAVDAFDALTHQRCYKESYTKEKAIEILAEENYSDNILSILSTHMLNPNMSIQYKAR